MNIGHLSSVLSLGLVLWSGSSFVVAERNVFRTQPPALARDAQPVVSVGVDLSHIAKFNTYNTNELNPFVPYSEQVEERKERRRRRNKPKVARRPSETAPLPVVEAPVRPLKLPTLVLPVLKAQDVVVPTVLGVVHAQDRFFALVQIAGKERQMTKDGEAFKGWVLTGIENKLATFIDPDGEELKVPVGMGGTGANVVSATQQAASKSTQGKKGALPANLDMKKIMQMMADPAQRPKLLKMAQDPRYRDLLKDPVIRDLIMQQSAVGGSVGHQHGGGGRR